MTTAVGIERAHFILTDIAHNNNKFWNIEMDADGTVRTHWGRVGDVGQSKTFPGAGASFFQAKCREKQGKGYKPVRTVEAVSGQSRALSHSDVAAVAAEQIETDCPEVTQLIARLSKANIHDILSRTTMQYDTSRGTFSTPLGILTEDAIGDARNLLTRIGQFVHADQYGSEAFAQTVSEYLMLVPQNIGRGKPDLHKLYPNLQAVQAQNAILDALEVSLQSVLAAPQDAEPKPVEKVFDVKLRRVEAGGEIDRIQRKYRETMQRMHACAHLDVKAVYALELASMRQAFETQGRPLGNVWELWHGTKIANLLSILKSGLRVLPPRSAHITGKMFGNGLYFSDQSTKALNYAYGYWDGKREDNCFMLLCDVAMGCAYTPRSYTERFPHPDSDSTFARAGVSGVQNNEMIVYKDHQVDITFLVEFSPRGK